VRRKRRACKWRRTPPLPSAAARCVAEIEELGRRAAFVKARRRTNSARENRMFCMSFPLAVVVSTSSVTLAGPTP
jgi:hypothetical protein